MGNARVGGIAARELMVTHVVPQHPRIEIEYYDERRIGCIECNRWG